jgi:hypothetical protein
MKSICLAGGLIALASVTSCVSDLKTPIPNGVYREPSKVEAVTVNGPKLEFQIRAPKGAFQGKMATREYDYGMTDNDEIHIIGSSGDAVFVEAIIAYEWYWDGKRIIRKRVYYEGDVMRPVKKYGETVIFTTEAAR